MRIAGVNIYSGIWLSGWLCCDVSGSALQSTAAGVVQTSQTAPAQSAAGVESPYDARKIVADILKEQEQFRPLLTGMNPQEWYDKKGAPSTYILLWQTAQRQLQDVEITANLTSQKVESLSQLLDMYFRLEALETTARSVGEGAQKYADRASADRLTQLIARNFDTRQRLRDYIRDLAISVEQNFKIADEEAQRCRAMISREPPRVRTSKH